MITETLSGDTENEQFYKAMYAMVALGVGEIFGGLFIGQVIDRLSNKAAAWTNIILITIQTIVVLAFLVVDEYNWLVFAFTFIWGF
jgi:predicted MFS family arabinose efflux permease